MAIITESHLRNYKQKDLRRYKSQDSNNFPPPDTMGMIIRKQKEKKINIFLSHKHGDEENIEFLEKILDDCSLEVDGNVELYLDGKDENMSFQTNRKTAKEIKKKIKENDKFILLATDEAINSKWCNWELGFADSLKYKNNNLVLFPLKKDYEDWSGNEYMQLYPVIEYENGCSKNTNKKIIPEGYYVYYPQDRKNEQKYISLGEWLLKKNE